MPPLDGGCFIEAARFPMEFVLIRASDVPRFVQDENTTLGVGITGSDIIWEAGLGKNNGEEIPIYELNPDAKQSSLFVGITKRLQDALGNRSPDISDLAGSQIATKFPAIANEYFAEKNINPELILVPGSDEAMQYIFPNCNGILGIISTGDTIKENNIDILEKFYDVTIRLIENGGKLSSVGQRILDEFREKVFVALQRRGML